MSIPEEKNRVDFNAPESLVEEADAVAELLDTSRTSLLIDGLRKQLDDIETDDGFRRRLEDAYYSERVDYDVVETVIGREEAMRMKLLRGSLGRDPPAPESNAVDLPAADDFYDGKLPEWTRDDADSDDDELPTST